ncbi:MAG TPA: hypothetical protein VJ836_04715 [Candidatus Saccharimonadales bacterium]|nr:hypothetical protein [Candidatus Saccharimonadales bacterium]
MARQNTIYEQVVDISRDYLGPAGERFMRRQINTHLRKEPEDLTVNDIPELINWTRLTLALLTDDTRLIDSFTDRLTSLTQNKRQTPRKSGVR